MKKADELALCLTLIDDKYQYKVNLEECFRDQKLIDSTIRFAKRNGLYYIFINNLIKSGFRLSLSEKNKLKSEDLRRTEFKEMLSLLNRLSNEYEIENVIIKSCDTIPHVPRDIDFFVKQADRTEIIEILKNSGLKCIHSGLSETSLIKNNIKIDIYTEICYMNKDFIDGAFLLKSNVQKKMFDTYYRSLNENANILLMLIHSLFGHRCITLLDFLHILNIIDNIDIKACQQYADNNGWLSIFNLMLDWIQYLYNQIYEEGRTFQFPYLFDRLFLKKCISEINDDIGMRGQIILEFVFFQDRIIYSMVDTPLYNLLKSNESIRNFINAISSYAKIARGDKKSISSCISRK